jgi:hypothetical protein
LSYKKGASDKLAEAYEVDFNIQLLLGMVKFKSYDVQVNSDAYIAMQQHLCKRSFRQCFSCVEF